MPKERRAYERFNVEGRAVLKPRNEKSRVVNADLRGISFLGFSVDSQEKIEQGTYVKFELTVKSSNETFGGRGKIAHSSEITKYGSRFFQMGIEFVNIDNEKLPYFVHLIRHDIMGKSGHKQ